MNDTDGIDALLGELTQTYGESLVWVGFPPPKDVPETPTCGVMPLCNRTGKPFP